MTKAEFLQMLDLIEDWWRSSNDWRGGVETLYELFTDLDTDEVYECLIARRDGDPEKAQWAPKPPELRALTLDRMRQAPPPPALPETTETYNWREHSQRTYGEIISPREALARKVEELA